MSEGDGRNGEGRKDGKMVDRRMNGEVAILFPWIIPVASNRKVCTRLSLRTFCL